MSSSDLLRLEETRVQFDKNELGGRDLPFHMARAYFFGDNSTKDKWRVSYEPPAVIKKEVFLNSYAEFARDINKEGRWSRCESRMLLLIKIAMPPLAALYKRRVRQRKFEEFRNNLARGEVHHYVWISTEARIFPE